MVWYRHSRFGLGFFGLNVNGGFDVIRVFMCCFGFVVFRFVGFGLGCRFCWGKCFGCAWLLCGWLGSLVACYDAICWVVHGYGGGCGVGVVALLNSALWC